MYVQQPGLAHLRKQDNQGMFSPAKNKCGCIHGAKLDQYGGVFFCGEADRKAIGGHRAAAGPQNNTSSMPSTNRDLCMAWLNIGIVEWGSLA